MIAEIGKGAVAGTIATVPMSVVLLAGAKARAPRNPEAAFPPRKVAAGVTEGTGLWDEDSPVEQEVITWASHISYGAIAGALYAPLACRARLPLVAGGVAFGLGVWAASYAGWLPAAGVMRPPQGAPLGQTIQTIAAHVVWGAVAGLVLRDVLRLQTRDTRRNRRRVRTPGAPAAAHLPALCPARRRAGRFEQPRPARPQARLRR